MIRLIWKYAMSRWIEVYFIDFIMFDKYVKWKLFKSRYFLSLRYNFMNGVDPVHITTRHAQMDWFLSLTHRFTSPNSLKSRYLMNLNMKKYHLNIESFENEKNWKFFSRIKFVTGFFSHFRAHTEICSIWYATYHILHFLLYMR